MNYNKQQYQQNDHEPPKKYHEIVLEMHKIIGFKIYLQNNNQSIRWW